MGTVNETRQFIDRISNLESDRAALISSLREYLTGTPTERNHSGCEGNPCTVCKIAARVLAKAEGR